MLQARPCRNAVAKHQWGGRSLFDFPEKPSCINGSVELWRRCFPNATCANISYNTKVNDSDFIHLRGLHTLWMDGCEQSRDAALEHLAGIQALSLMQCQGITDKGIVYLAGISLLNIRFIKGITETFVPILFGARAITLTFSPWVGYHRCPFSSAGLKALMAAGTEIEHFDDGEIRVGIWAGRGGW